MCAGLPGAQPDPAVLSELVELAPAGVVLFARNVSSPEGTRALVDAVRAANGADTFVALDQEGGRVARLRTGFAPIPSMMALGACGDAQLAERLGHVIAGDLTRVGADVDFAPVVDLALEPANAVIGTRSFGDDPQRAGALGAALVRGLQNGGVAATLKHFPGHGATELDSHRDLPRLEAELDTLRAREFVPFAAGIAAGARAVMSAHVVVPALDPRVPATLSARAMRDVLRAELGFRGVCFTDALEMEAIAGSVGSARAAVLALAAGVDCVVAAAGLELAREVRAAVIAALESGELPVARLREACGRIARLREGLPSRQRHAEHADHAAGADDADDAGIGMEIARRSITLLHGDPRLDLTQPLSLVSFEGSEFDGAADAAAEAGAKGTAERPSLNLALRRRHVRSELLRVALDPAPEMLAQLLELIQTQRRQVAIVIRRAHRHPSQAHALDALLTIAPQAIVVSALEPFDAPLAKRARAVLCSYGDGETAIEAVADVLTGRLEPRGTLPVRLERAG